MKCLAALCLLFLCGCAQSSRVVQAATPTPTPALTAADCQEEVFADTTTEDPIETADYLQFPSHVCPLTVAVHDAYTLKFDHLVQGIDLEGGSLNATTLEWAFWVDFDTPAGRHVQFFEQYDKHQDVKGNVHTYRPVSLNLPGGTVVTIRRAAMPPSFCISGAPCFTGQKVELVGKF